MAWEWEREGDGGGGACIFLFCDTNIPYVQYELIMEWMWLWD